nr:PPC domain-containing protein [Anaerolineae bacterium]
LAVAPSLSFGQTVNGNITLENKFDVYTFEGTAGQVISINMIRTQGTSLDTKLFLISPSLFEVADNDDAAPGVTTDSAITRFTLPETGRYTILATHYGTIYGVTTGPYSLTLSQQ